MTGLGVGVHRTRLRSFSFPATLPSHLADRSIASALRVAAALSAVRSSSLLAAGVRLPAASERRGVHDGGAMFPFFPAGVLSALMPYDLPACPKPSNSALVRRLFEALLESL